MKSFAFEPTANLVRRTFLFGTLASLAASQAWAAGQTSKQGFNDTTISWRAFEEGSIEARDRRKPILLLVHTTWCPHCLSYRNVFFDPDVVRRLQHFIPILVDRDFQYDVSAQYAPDGNYIPRTMALTSDAKLMPQIVGENPKYRHFLPYDNPQHLLVFLERALSQFEDASG